MKKENKKALYESIMKTVSKEIKKLLNESQNPLNDYYDELVNRGIATESEIDLVTSINGYNEETLNDILYVKTGYHSLELMDGEYEDEEDDIDMDDYDNEEDIEMDDYETDDEISEDLDYDDETSEDVWDD